MWRLMTMFRTTSLLQVALYSLLILSTLVTFGSAMNRKLAKGLNWLSKKSFGRHLLPAKWRTTEISSSSFAARSKGSWEWILNWRNKWRGYATTVGIAAIVVFSVIMFAIVPVSNRVGPIPVTTRYLIYLPHVPQAMDDWTYVGHDLDPKSQMFGKDFVIVFCKQAGYKPPFDEGETFEYLSFKNYGACWEPVSYRMDRAPDRAYTLVVK